MDFNRIMSAKLYRDDTTYRRDFRHSHDGPEIMPHRKRAKKRDKSKCLHDYVVVTRFLGMIWYRCSKCGRYEQFKDGSPVVWMTYK